MTKILFRPIPKKGEPTPPEPEPSITVNFRLSARPPYPDNLAVVQMDAADLPEYDTIEIYSRDDSGKETGLYCTINGVPPVSDTVLQCSGAANAQNGASYIAKFKKDGAVVERAIANIAELYTSSVTVHTSTFDLPSSGTFDATVDANNFPYGNQGHFYGVDNTTGALTKVFTLTAQTMRGNMEFNVRVLADMTQFSKFVCQAVRNGNVLYQCNANITY